MKSILSLWQQWLHIENLINKRKKTISEFHNLDGEDPFIVNFLKTEFPEEYPNNPIVTIVDGLMLDILKMWTEFNYYKKTEDNGVINISFFKNNVSLPIANISIKVNLEVTENEESIITVIKDGNETHIHNDANAETLLLMLDTK